MNAGMLRGSADSRIGVLGVVMLVIVGVPLGPSEPLIDSLGVTVLVCAVATCGLWLNIPFRLAAVRTCCTTVDDRNTCPYRLLHLGAAVVVARLTYCSCPSKKVATVA